MVTVPAVLPGTRHLNRNPVIMYMPDEFEKPYPFRPAVAVDVRPVMDRIVAMLHCHTSQFYEWLAYNTGVLDQVPASDDERRAWLCEQVRGRLRRQAARFRDLLAPATEFAEAFEPCEYGAPLDDAARRRLFPFHPG
jgi:N-acetylglucosamine malate deacetylase 1